MHLTLDAILALTVHYGYLFLFIVSFLEGPIATVIGGFLAAQGIFNPYLVYAITFFGDLFGDLGYYYIGWLGKRGIIKGKHRFFNYSKEKIEQIEKLYGKYSGRTLVIGKLTHSMGFAVLIAAGAAEMPLLPFIVYNTIAGIPKVLLFLLLGYYAGSAYNLIDSNLKIISVIMFILISALIAIFYFRFKKQNKDISA